MSIGFRKMRIVNFKLLSYLHVHARTIVVPTLNFIHRNNYS